MPGIDSSRPPKLYRYSDRQWLERALTLGEFRLSPPAANPGQPAARYLTLGWTRNWKDSLFDTFGVDTCLIIHDTEQFGERLHRAAQKILPSWAGIDAPVYYGKPSPLGALFSKERADAAQEEWLFAWRPTEAMLSLHPVFVRMGSIESIAEIRDKSTPTGSLH
ncbi:MAG: hypothetical protein JO002_03410 [Burkholderiaceae bacterium]|nr:hypothetical protein [Burkholderiaceae bacterium]